MNEVETKDVGTTDLSAYMMKVIEELRRDRKPPAVHIYTCTLRSFIRFSDNGEEECSMPMQEVFTPGRLKEYEQWMLLRKLTQNTISTYMRTLRAVYNRWMPPGTAEHNPRLFDDVYTSVVSQTKRALTARQMEKLLEADLSGLSPQQQAVLAYFLLMFLLRGMPFIDLAHLRKRDMQDGRITYSRHKTDKPITVRIPREALVLIAKYADRHSASPYLFPILDARIRDSWQSYRNYQDALRHFNRKLGQVMSRLLPGVRVSSYVARHTFATLALTAGVDIYTTSQLLGHANIRHTQRYAQIINSKKDHAVSLLDDAFIQ
ncbi:site-specific integrase [Bacteroides sp.]|uniref:tyrosine-type recombinase/integrase n=1 Tax=Bacteroides sp. TaxID=29523 RepID=UPI00258BFEB2|nr:site-specific integrase [Bacteroides sp.]